MNIVFLMTRPDYEGLGGKVHSRKLRIRMTSIYVEIITHDNISPIKKNITEQKGCPL